MGKVLRTLTGSTKRRDVISCQRWSGFAVAVDGSDETVEERRRNNGRKDSSVCDLSHSQQLNMFMVTGGH